MTDWLAGQDSNLNLVLSDSETRLVGASWRPVAFIKRYNREWLIERHGHRTPADVRQQLLQAA